MIMNFSRFSVKHWVREGKGGETGEMRLERRWPHPQSPLPPSPAVTGVLILIIFLQFEKWFLWFV